MQYEMSLADYLRVFKKRWPIIVITVFFVLAVSYYYIIVQKPIYRTTTTVEVIRRGVVGGLLEGGMGISARATGTVFTNTEIIKSDAVMSRAAEKLGLIKPNMTNYDRYRQISALKRTVSVSVVQNTNLINISVQGGNQHEIQRVANKVAESFVEYDTNKDRAEEIAIEAFIMEQLEAAQRRLQEAENALLAYKQSEYEAPLDENVEITSQTLKALEVDFIKTRQDRQEKEIRVRNLRQLVEREDLSEYNIAAMRTDPIIVELKSRHFSISSKLDSLMADFTEEHPLVIETKKQYAEVSERFQEELKKVITSQVNDLLSEISFLREKEASLQTRIEYLNEQLKILPEKELHLSQIRRKISVNSDIVQMLQKRQEEKRIVKAGKIGGLQVIEPATTPAKIYPRERATFLTSSLIGLLLGTALTFVIESLDTSIGTIEDVEKYTSKPVVGVIPHIKATAQPEKTKKWKFYTDGQKPALNDLKQKIEDIESGLKEKTRFKPALDPRLITFFDPKSPISEAYRILRTNLMFLDAAKNAVTILITSSGPQEGKTTTVSNLGVTMAQMGSKTMILSCNLRRPKIYKIFALNKRQGLVDVLLGNISLKEAVKKTVVPNLDVITCGGVPPNPSELLGSAKMREVVAELRKEYDYVLIDTPPMLPVTDAAVMANFIDATVIVYFIGKAAREALLRAKIQLENVKSNVVGIVLNDLLSKAELGKGSYYYYYYHYKYYGNENTKRKANA